MEVENRWGGTNLPVWTHQLKHEYVHASALDFGTVSLHQLLPGILQEHIAALQIGELLKFGGFTRHRQCPAVTELKHGRFERKQL